MASPYTKVLDQDAYVLNTNPTTNYGSNTQLAAHWDNSHGKGGDDIIYHTYALVDFSDLDIVASQVTSAYVYLRWTVHDDWSPHWYRCTDYTWDESTITWTNQPAHDTDMYTGHYTLVTGSWAYWDITDLIKDAITYRSKVWNAKLVGEIFGTAIQTFWAYSTEEGGNDGALRPYIIINYSAVAGAISKIAGVAWASVSKVSGVAEASISKVSGVVAN